MAMTTLSTLSCPCITTGLVLQVRANSFFFFVVVGLSDLCVHLPAERLTPLRNGFSSVATALVLRYGLCAHQHDFPTYFQDEKFCGFGNYPILVVVAPIVSKKARASLISDMHSLIPLIPFALVESIAPILCVSYADVVGNDPTLIIMISDSYVSLSLCVSMEVINQSLLFYLPITHHRNPRKKTNKLRSLHSSALLFNIQFLILSRSLTDWEVLWRTF